MIGFNIHIYVYVYVYICIYVYIYTHMHVVICQKWTLASTPSWHRVPRPWVPVVSGVWGMQGMSGWPQESLGEEDLLLGEVQRVWWLRQLLFYHQVPTAWKEKDYGNLFFSIFLSWDDLYVIHQILGAWSLPTFLLFLLEWGWCICHIFRVETIYS